MKKKKRKELTEEEMRRNAEWIVASMEHWNDDRRGESFEDYKKRMDAPTPFCLHADLEKRVSHLWVVAIGNVILTILLNTVFA